MCVQGRIETDITALLSSIESNHSNIEVVGHEQGKASAMGYVWVWNGVWNEWCIIEGQSIKCTSGNDSSLRTLSNIHVL